MAWFLGRNMFDENIGAAYNNDGELSGAGGTPETMYYVQDDRYLEVELSMDF